MCKGRADNRLALPHNRLPPCSWISWPDCQTTSIDNLRHVKNDPIRMYILSRDQAYFKTPFFSGDRLGDLGQVRTNEILRFPSDDGLMFNHTWGKTLRGDRWNLFGIKRCANIKICPVAAIERYMATIRAMQVDLADGFLFRPTTAPGAISPLSISSEAINGRLKT